jgi:K+-transporting ATPase ATPase C chain
MKSFIISIKIFLFLTILTGFAYPLLITGITQLAFPGKANGSLISLDNRIIGSKLIGQEFDQAGYFASRPSSIFYNPMPSGGSNYGPTNQKLKELVSGRKSRFIATNQTDSLIRVPAEMLFASGSGLDPHISPQSALLQVDRISRERNLDSIQKQKIIHYIQEHIEPPQFSILGNERINLLLLNLELDRLVKKN